MIHTRQVIAPTCEFWFTLTVVGVYSIHTCPFILALVTWTVINVVIAGFSCKAWSKLRQKLCKSFNMGLPCVHRTVSPSTGGSSTACVILARPQQAHHLQQREWNFTTVKCGQLTNEGKRSSCTLLRSAGNLACNNIYITVELHKSKTTGLYASWEGPRKNT